MENNPAIVAWFFDRRVDIFMKTFMKKFFPVKDFWFRYEWQHRGSPHIHGLMWFEGAPDCSNIGSLRDEERERIVLYFDDLVSACLGEHQNMINVPNPCRRRLTDLTPIEREDDLDKLLFTVQRHSRCGPHCMRKKRGTRRIECRFKFPMDLEEESTLRLEEGSWKFFPKRNDALLQRFNKFVTQVWRANTDFSPITSKDAVLNYISKYASKGEYASESYSIILRRVLNRNPIDTPAATLVRQLLVSSVAERNYSAQEIQHLLMGWPLYHYSRSIIVLSLREDWVRFGAPQGNTLVSHYAHRTDSLDSLSLYDFAKNFRFEGQRIIRRHKECVVRVIPYLTLSDDPTNNDEFYKLQVKLHVPWKRFADGNETRDRFRLPGSNQFRELNLDDFTWQEIYLLANENGAPRGSLDDANPFQPEEPEY
jgi:ATP-dependent DNA helicase PIF1